jgi:hypothetical protein
MAQQKFPLTPGDNVASICDSNFDELYAADVVLTSAVATAQGAGTLALSAGTPFMVTANLTSAAAGTAVHILPAATVGAAKKAYGSRVAILVNGATAWTDITGTVVQIQDTNGTPVVGATWLKALLIGNAVLTDALASTLGPAMVNGFTTAKGIDIVADANFAAGSTINVRIWGYIA